MPAKEVSGMGWDWDGTEYFGFSKNEENDGMYTGAEAG